MKILDAMAGQRFCPLDVIEIVDVPASGLKVFDGFGREYFTTPTGGSVRFKVGGAGGTHCARSASESIHFVVEPKTDVRDGSGRYKELLTMLLFTMLDEQGEEHTCLWNGKIYRYFICWLRDHVHVLKGMKYFSQEVKSAIELYRDTQREDGMIFDNCCRKGPDPTYWEVRFSEGDFYKSIAENRFEMKRIPVENDVEYLYVEGIYYSWKATGDDAWMCGFLDSAQRALEYSVTSEYRWSEALGVLKRGHTIDTWDFQNEEDCTVEGDIMRIRPGVTRFGAMFGDTTGYVAACNQLAEMLEHVGRSADAARYRDRAIKLAKRIQEIAWLGTHFQHHVPEDPFIDRKLGPDPKSQVSLSNAYSLNRGISLDKCAAIIETYRRIQSDLPEGSPGEWYTIYPPFDRGYNGHSNKWQYMNASVTPIVAGELARGAFHNGYEKYGGDVLNRLVDLGIQHGRRFHCSYTGSIPEIKPKEFRTVDIGAFANMNVHGGPLPNAVGWPGPADNDLRELPTGRQEFHGIPFDVPNPAVNNGCTAVAIGIREGYHREVSIPVSGTAGSLYLFHCSSGGSYVGSLTIRYHDGSEVSMPIRPGHEVAHWWMPELPEVHGTRYLELGWKGKNPKLPFVAVAVWSADNPYPDKELDAIVFRCAPNDMQWMVMGLSLCVQSAGFSVSPISFGIPNGWGAAAVVYALLEGLAGVVDRGTNFDHVEIAPRWSSVAENSAEVTVHYPAGGGYAAYRYHHDLAAKTLSIEITGSGKSADLRILLPEGATRAHLDGSDQPLETETVRASTYAVLALDTLVPQTRVFHYA